MPVDSFPLIGNAIGPSAVGLLNDLLQAEFGERAIRYSLLIVALSPVLAAACFWRAATHYGAMRNSAVEAGRS